MHTYMPMHAHTYMHTHTHARRLVLDHEYDQLEHIISRFRNVVTDVFARV